MAENERVRRVVTSVYVAMIAAVFVCVLIVAFFPVPSRSAAPSDRARWALLILGAAEYAIATVVASRGARGGVERVRSGYLIRFAAAEALAIFGVALHFLGTSAGWSFVFLGASVAALAHSAPRREVFEGNASSPRATR